MGKAVIYKYPIDSSSWTLALPESFRVLKVAWQKDDICLWALVDPSEPTVVIRLLVVGTGQPLEDVIWDRRKYEYLDSAVSDNLVFHVFRVLK